MLNARNIGELLSRNVHSELYQCIFVMTPSGTLVAYSTPVNMKQLRDQASLISLVWKDNVDGTPSSADSPSSPALTVQTESHNILVRQIQPKLLLVLVGGLAEGHSQSFRIIFDNELEDKASSAHEANGEEPDELERAEREIPPDADPLLYVQRQKASRLCRFIETELAARSFVMPGDTIMGKPFS